jgi:hypothetical protein
MKAPPLVASQLLFLASVAGGLALNAVIPYSMLIGLGLGIFILLSSFILAKRKTKQ